MMDKDELAFNETLKAAAAGDADAIKELAECGLEAAPKRESVENRNVALITMKDGDEALRVDYTPKCYADESALAMLAMVRDETRMNYGAIMRALIRGERRTDAFPYYRTVDGVRAACSLPASLDIQS